MTRLSVALRKIESSMSKRSRDDVYDFSDATVKDINKDWNTLHNPSSSTKLRIQVNFNGKEDNGYTVSLRSGGALSKDSVLYADLKETIPNVVDKLDVPCSYNEALDILGYFNVKESVAKAFLKTVHIRYEENKKLRGISGDEE